MESIYKSYRAEMEKVLKIDCDWLSWETLAKFSIFLCNNLNDSLKLYNYCSPVYHNIRNFETGKIYLSKTGDFNDIYENLAIADFSAIEKEKLFLLNDIAYVKCFTEESNNNLMWSHYADEHKGFCLEYNLSLLDKSDDVLKHIFPVVYQDSRNFGCDDLKDFFEDLIAVKNFILGGEEIFDEESYRYSALLSLFKGEDWSYEKEWRIIYPKSEIYTNNYNVFEKQLMEFDCVSAIYLGYRINSEVKENLIEIVQRKNKIRNKLNIESIKVYEMSLYKDSYKLKPKEIEVL